MTGSQWWLLSFEFPGAVLEEPVDTIGASRDCQEELAIRLHSPFHASSRAGTDAAHVPLTGEDVSAVADCPKEQAERSGRRPAFDSPVEFTANRHGDPGNMALPDSLVEYPGLADVLGCHREHPVPRPEDIEVDMHPQDRLEKVPSTHSARYSVSSSAVAVLAVSDMSGIPSSPDLVHAWST